MTPETMITIVAVAAKVAAPILMAVKPPKKTKKIEMGFIAPPPEK